MKKLKLLKNLSKKNKERQRKKFWKKNSPTKLKL